ncbi:hypothetical protein [Kiloniella sp.]
MAPKRSYTSSVREAGVRAKVLGEYQKIIVIGMQKPPIRIAD